MLYSVVLLLCCHHSSGHGDLHPRTLSLVFCAMQFRVFRLEGPSTDSDASVEAVRRSYMTSAGYWAVRCHEPLNT